MIAMMIVLLLLYIGISVAYVLLLFACDIVRRLLRR